MTHELYEPHKSLKRQLDKLESLVTISPAYLNKHALHLVRALAPAGANYPRAAVVRQESGKWAIRIKHHAVHYEGDYLLHKDGKPLTFALHRGAMSHASREINALRARRHPAGQSWLRSSAGSEVPA